MYTWGESLHILLLLLLLLSLLVTGGDRRWSIMDLNRVNMTPNEAINSPKWTLNRERYKTINS